MCLETSRDETRVSRDSITARCDSVIHIRELHWMEITGTNSADYAGISGDEKCCGLLRGFERNAEINTHFTVR